LPAVAVGEQALLAVRIAAQRLFSAKARAERILLEWIV
jgi:hypothetical protein